MTSQMYNPSGLTSGDAYRLCPYDETHKIMAHCYQGHLVKCRRNHLSFRLVKCKWDGSHVFPEPEIKHHETKDCPSRYLMDRDLQKMVGGNSGLMGDVAGPEIVSSYNTETDWDTESNEEFSGMGLYNRRDNDSSNTKGFGLNFPDPPRGYPDRNRGAPTPEAPTTSRVPHHPSMAAKLSAPAKLPVAPGNQVFTYSANQAKAVNQVMGAVGAGRGRGSKPNGHGACPGSPQKAAKPVPMGRGIARFATKTKSQHSDSSPLSVGAESRQFDDDVNEEEDRRAMELKREKEETELKLQQEDDRRAAEDDRRNAELKREKQEIELKLQQQNQQLREIEEKQQHQDILQQQLQKQEEMLKLYGNAPTTINLSPVHSTLPVNNNIALFNHMLPVTTTPLMNNTSQMSNMLPVSNTLGDPSQQLFLNLKQQLLNQQQQLLLSQQQHPLLGGPQHLSPQTDPGQVEQLLQRMQKMEIEKQKLIEDAAKLGLSSLPVTSMPNAATFAQPSNTAFGRVLSSSPTIPGNVQTSNVPRQTENSNILVQDQNNDPGQAEISNGPVQFESNKAARSPPSRNAPVGRGKRSPPQPQAPGLSSSQRPQSPGFGRGHAPTSGNPARTDSPGRERAQSPWKDIGNSPSRSPTGVSFGRGKAPSPVASRSMSPNVQVGRGKGPSLVPVGRGRAPDMELRAPKTKAVAMSLKDPAQSVLDTNQQPAATAADNQNEGLVSSWLSSVDSAVLPEVEAFSKMSHEELQKVKKKLEKKLKQVRNLEERASKGGPLTEEEETKMQKKKELIEQVERINSLLR